MTTISLKDEDATRDLAERVGGMLAGGMTLGLVGDLGAGKTTFVRFLVTALGGEPRLVASPSFTLSYDYPVSNGLTIEHWDLYRLNAVPDELLEPPSGRTVRVIEWPDRCPDVLGTLDLVLRFVIGDNESRIVEVSGPAARSWT